MIKLPKKIWDLFYNNIMQNRDVEKLEGLNYWKHRIYTVVATVMIVFGVPLLIFGSSMFYVTDRFIMATFELVVALLFVVVILCPILKIKTKKISIIILMYIISLALLVSTGPSGAGFVSIVFTIVVSGCILEAKHIKVLVVINFIIFALLTLLMALNLLDAYMISDYGFTWAINILTSQALAIGLLMLIHWIYEGLEDQNKKILESERILKIKDSRYEGMVAHIFDVITIIDAKGEIKYISPNIYKLFAWRSDGVPGKRFLDFVHKEDQERVKEAFDYVLNLEGKTKSGVLNFLKGNGDSAYIEVTAINLIHNPSIQGVLASFRDVTTRVLNEAALIKAKEEAEAAEKAKSQFLSVMSHEIRTPLNGIMGMIQLMLDTNPTREQKNYLDVSMTSSKLLLNLMNDILDYSKLKTYNITLEKIRVDIRKIIKDLEFMYTHELKEKELNFFVDIDAKIPEILVGDAFRLRQVLLNLLNNALKFTRQGFIKIKVSLFEETDDYVSLIWAISDSGIGMTKDQQNKIFSMFYQGEASTTRNYGGSGLGLPICKDIIALMGGEIWVASEINQGSVFKFSCILEKGKKSYEMIEENLNHKIHKDLKVLVAEDDEINRLLLKKISQKLDWEICFSKNGQEVLDAFEKNVFDLILMDVNMPIMDGLQATKRIREFDTQIPIIGISAFASPSDVKECLEAGMNATVSKPIDFNLLKETVIKWANK